MKEITMNFGKNRNSISKRKLKICGLDQDEIPSKNILNFNGSTKNINSSNCATSVKLPVISATTTTIFPSVSRNVPRELNKLNSFETPSNLKIDSKIFSTTIYESSTTEPNYHSPTEISNMRDQAKNYSHHILIKDRDKFLKFKSQKDLMNSIENEKKVMSETNKMARFVQNKMSSSITKFQMKTGISFIDDTKSMSPTLKKEPKTNNIFLPNTISEIKNLLAIENFPRIKLNFFENLENMPLQIEDKQNIKQKTQETLACFNKKSIQNFLKILHKDVLPSGRKDITDLTQWFREQIQNLNSNFTEDLKTDLKKQAILFAFVQRELIRQNKILMNERGEFMNELWNSFVNFLNTMLSFIKDHINKLDGYHQQDIATLKNGYEKKIQMEKVNNDRFKSEYDRRLQVIDIFEEQITQFKNKVATLEYTLTNKKNEVISLISKVQLLSNENELLKKFMEQAKIFVLTNEEDLPHKINNLYLEAKTNMNRLLTHGKEIELKYNQQISRIDENKQRADIIYAEEDNDQLKKFREKVDSVVINKLSEDGTIIGEDKVIDRIDTAMKNSMVFDKAIDTREFVILLNLECQATPHMLEIYHNKETSSKDLIITHHAGLQTDEVKNHKLIQCSLLKARITQDQEVQTDLQIELKIEVVKEKQIKLEENLLDKGLKPPSEKAIAENKIHLQKMDQLQLEIKELTDKLNNGEIIDEKLQQEIDEKSKELKNLQKKTEKYQKRFKKSQQNLDDPFVENELDRSRVSSVSGDDTLALKQNPTVRGVTPSISKRREKRKNQQLNNKIQELKDKQNEEIEIATNILQKYLEAENELSVKNKKDKPIMPKFSVMKLIMQIYDECVQKGEHKLGSVEFYIIVYRFFINKYTISNMAGKKYKDLLKSVNCYIIESPRIKMFGKFLGICSIYDQQTFYLFIKFLRYYQSKGVDIVKDFSKGAILILCAYVFEAARSIFSEFDNSFHEKLKEKLDKVKESDGKTSYKNFFDFDKSIDILLTHYNLNKHMGNPYEEIFYLADINGDGTLEFEEFVRITRHMEPDYFLENSIKFSIIFDDYSENIDDERVMSLKKFKEMCNDLRLYSKESQNKFIKKSSLKGFSTSITTLVNKWVNIREQLKKPLIQMNIFHTEFKLIYEKLDKYIRHFEEMYSQKIWLNYKIFENEIERLYEEWKLSEYIAPEILELNSCFVNGQ